MPVLTSAVMGLLAAGMAIVAPANSQDDDIAKYIINSPPVASWQVNGVQTQPRAHHAAGVLGERAITVQAHRSSQPWSVSAQMPIRGEIKQGDTILLAVWARLATPPAGETTSRLPVRIQQATPPYDALADGSGEIGPEWKMVYASGVAAQDYAGGATNLAVHLATADHSVELGPALVLDFGQNYDPRKLPTN